MSGQSYSYPPVSPSPPARGIRSVFRQNAPPVQSILEWLQTSNRWIIIVLVFLLVMAMFDVRILNTLYTIVLRTVQLIMNLVMRLLMVTGFVAGNTLEVAGDLIGETGDVAQYTLGSVGKTLQQAGAEGTGTSRSLFPPRDKQYTPAPNQVDVMGGQNESGAMKWCMVGDQSSKKGCMQMNKNDKCLSGKQYRTSAECLKDAALQ